MIRDFVDRLFEQPWVTRVPADPSPQNVRAILSLEKARFMVRKEATMPDGTAMLVVSDR